MLPVGAPWREGRGGGPCSDRPPRDPRGALSKETAAEWTRGFISLGAVGAPATKRGVRAPVRKLGLSSRAKEPPHPPSCDVRLFRAG